jgi:uncharacterized protein
VCGTLQVRHDQWSWQGPVPPRTGGWYRDPIEHYPYRYWDGETWTDRVGPPRTDPSHAFDLDAFSPGREVEPPGALGHGALRTGSTGLGLAGLLAAFGLSGFVALLWALVGHPGGELTLLVVSEIGLWIGLFGTCLLLTKRYGSGDLRRDFNLRVRPIDLVFGPIAGVIAGVISEAIAVALRYPSTMTGHPNLLGVSLTGAAAWIVLAALVTVGAPFFEELFFRGLLQGIFIGRFGSWIGVPLTAVIFGSAHVFNAPGTAGLIYALSIMGAGLVLGTVYASTQRLGTSMIAHCTFNTVSLVLVATSTIR